METTALHQSRWRFIGTRRAVLIGIAVAGIWAFIYLGLSPAQLWPTGKHWDRIGAFFSAALTPAMTHEESVPPGTSPLMMKVGAAALTTLIFAVAAASLSVLIGLVLAFFGSTAWWANDPVGAAGPFQRVLRRTIRPAVFVVTRVVIALSRSTHELIWAILFLAAFGVVDFIAVLAIVIPYSGTLAKVFSEMIDESPREAADVLRASGASPAHIFLFGLLPRALPDMAAYSLYRFECALRSSAIVGFFGFPTIGYFISDSFTAGQDHEVWTYLYALLVMIIAVDWWSGALRRRLTA